MGDLLTNLRLRLAQLDTNWEELAKAAGENPTNIRAVVRRGTPQGKSLRRLARIVGVPAHELLAPDFDPRQWPAPEGFEQQRKDSDGETVCDKFNDGDGEAM
jgi:hypothetical protein